MLGEVERSPYCSSRLSTAPVRHDQALEFQAEAIEFHEAIARGSIEVYWRLSDRENSGAPSDNVSKRLLFNDPHSAHLRLIDKRLIGT